ncbi:MAG: hypothetical protein Q8Q23_05510 [bacterium]|nr:hypothetical protein [bacterium]
MSFFERFKSGPTPKEQEIQKLLQEIKDREAQIETISKNSKPYQGHGVTKVDEMNISNRKMSIEQKKAKLKELGYEFPNEEVESEE